jgi:phosphopantothenoylcysteine decarboxylase/phosphopantothenate--cysteine ligase
MGYAIAAELALRGAEVFLISGRTALDAPQGVRRVDVVSAEDMYRACVELWPRMDGAVMCAAVADYTPVEVSATKIKKGLNFTTSPSSDNEALQGGEFCVLLKPTKDIAAELGRTKRPDQLLVGFALETDHEEVNALSKLERKNLDLIVLNSLRDAGAGFGGDTNLITVFDRSGNKTTYPLETKRQAASHIIDHLESCKS